MAPGGCTRQVRSNWTSQTDRGRRKQSERRISTGRCLDRTGRAESSKVLNVWRARFSRYSCWFGVLVMVRGQQLSFLTDEAMSAACLAWTSSWLFQGRRGHTTSRTATRMSSAQPMVWMCVLPRDGFEVEELAVEWKANSHEFDKQGHFREGTN